MKILLLYIGILTICTQVKGQNIKNYTYYTGISWSEKNNEQYIILRKFYQNQKLYFLGVNPNTLETKIISSTNSKYIKANWSSIAEVFPNSLYLKIINNIEKHDDSLQNAGITNFTINSNKFVLTIDLCPSPKPLDKYLFDSVFKYFNHSINPVPVGVSLSGNWIEHHRKELKWLIELEKKGKITIEWINHSYYHKGEKNVSHEENYLLLKGTDLNEEILGNEKLMLQSGIVPSVFFRFPGLISDSLTYHIVLRYGLIPIGSNAWIGKNQFPDYGSIVLVHGNGNEPIGITKLFWYVSKMFTPPFENKWKLISLKDAIMEQYKLDLNIQPY